VASTATKTKPSLPMFTRLTCGSRMPSGSSPRNLGNGVADVGYGAIGRRSDAELNKGVAEALAHVGVDLVDAFDAADRASTFCVTWLTSSDGAAPGWEMDTVAAGKSMSGWSVTSMVAKA
jgi:hypothetical protein